MGRLVRRLAHPRQVLVRIAVAQDRMVWLLGELIAEQDQQMADQRSAHALTASASALS